MTARSPSTLLDNPLTVDAALFGVAMMWASTFTLFKIAWKDIDPVAFTGIRFGSMVILSGGLLVLSKHRVRPRREDVPLLVASGLTGYFLYQMGFVLGLERTSALASAILISTHPIFSVMFMRLVRRERPARNEMLGVVVAFLGVAVFLRFWSAFGAAKPGDLYSLGAAAAFGAYGVINQPLAARYPSRELMAYGLAVGGVLITLVAIPDMVHQNWSSVGAPAWTILVYAVVGPVYLAYTLWNWGIRRRGIPRTVVYGFLVPILGGALAVAALHEPLRPEQVVGAVLVVAGLVLTRLRAGRSETLTSRVRLPAGDEAVPARVSPRAPTHGRRCSPRS
jgi:drug/metabolite transporter (DMT)-like permease